MASRNQRTFELRQFAPGLNTRLPAVQLVPGQSTVATNVDLSGGSIRRRTGYATVNASLPSTAAEVSALFPFYFQTTKQLLAVAGTYLMRSTGGAFTTITSTLRVSDAVRTSFASIDDKCYISVRSGADLAGQISKWDGTAYTATVSGSPTSALVAKWSNALWSAGDTTVGSQSRLRWSGLVGSSGSDTWPATNYVDLDPGDGDKIIGLGATLNALVVLKERSIFLIRGEPPNDAAVSAGSLAVTRLDRQPGCVAGATVASAGNQVIYLGRKGLYFFDGTSPRELTEAVRPFFEDVDVANLKNAVGGFISPTRYLLAIKDAASAIKVLHVNLDPFALTTWTGQNITGIGIFEFTADGEKPVIGIAGAVRYESGTSDAGSAIPWTYTTGVLPFGPATWLKILRWGYLRADASSEDITVTALKNFETAGSSAIVSTTPSGTEDPVTARFVVPGVARAVQLKFTGAGATTPAEIHEVVCDYMVRNVP